MLLVIGCKNTGAQDEKAVTLQSGVRYIEHAAGSGEGIQNGDYFSFHIIGWVVKDTTTMFQDWSNDTTKSADIIVNSKLQNEPIKMKLGGSPLTPGMEEGILGMKPGSKRTIIVPPALAFGTQGIEGQIPANSIIKIVVEMIEIKKPVEVTEWKYDPKSVKTTKSGLKYVIIQEGKGENPKTGDVVKVHYSGFLKDGKKFDSSVERNEPFQFTLGQGQVIKGWDEGIALLKPGAKAKLIIPSELGYGPNGAGGVIPPNAELIFDVELIDFSKK